MKKLIIILSAFIVASTSLVIADNFDNEVMPMLYLKVPIDSKHTMRREAEYGAALGIVGTSQNASERGKVTSFMDTDRPRLLDLRFKQDSIDSLQVNGVSLVQKIVKVNANGTTTEEAGLANLTPAQWILIGLGVGATLCATDVICDDDDDDPPPVADDVVIGDDVMADAIL